MTDPSRYAAAAAGSSIKPPPPPPGWVAGAYPQYPPPGGYQLHPVAPGGYYGGNPPVALASYPSYLHYQYPVAPGFYGGNPFVAPAASYPSYSLPAGTILLLPPPVPQPQNTGFISGMLESGFKAVVTSLARHAAVHALLGDDSGIENIADVGHAAATALFGDDYDAEYEGQYYW